MDNISAWETIQKLLLKLEKTNKINGTSHYICPICKAEVMDNYGHHSGCELENAISTIGSMIYS